MPDARLWSVFGVGSTLDHGPMSDRMEPGQMGSPCGQTEEVGGARVTKAVMKAMESVG